MSCLSRRESAGRLRVHSISPAIRPQSKEKALSAPPLRWDTTAGGPGDVPLKIFCDMPPNERKSRRGASSPLGHDCDPPRFFPVVIEYTQLGFSAMLRALSRPHARTVAPEGAGQSNEHLGRAGGTPSDGRSCDGLQEPLFSFFSA